MKILIINCGSSSLKYQLIDMTLERILAQGAIERIGIEGSNLTQKVEGREKYIMNKEISTHKDAIAFTLQVLVSKENGVISSMEEIIAVGHRVVHGGEKYAEAVLIDDNVKEYIKECYKIAPLHNPPNMIGIEACQELMKNIPMVAVFDTAFHQTMKENAFLYALPYELYKENGIRKYGFHGTSHMYVSRICAETMGKNIEDLKIITCHLGNGASLCAVKNGKSFDTTMGFTPLDGIAMEQDQEYRSAIPLYLISELNYTVDEVNELLNKKSGVLGLSNVSSDFRDIENAAADGDKRAKIALDVYAYKIKKEIGAYIVAMGGVDAIVFTAGVGENGPKTRIRSLLGLEFLGIKLDVEKNNVYGELREISTDDSKVKVFVIPTNEELVIARETKKFI
jgi:acetate kinase